MVEVGGTFSLGRAGRGIDIDPIPLPEGELFRRGVLHGRQAQGFVVLLPLEDG